MRIHAYHEMYLNRAQKNLGSALHYAVNDCDIPGAEFLDMFSACDISKRIENGEPLYLVGKSGIEIARDVVELTTGREFSVEPKGHFGRTKEYWIGWAVAYYQWISDRSYGEILRVVPYENLEKMYQVLHEADISKFVDIMDSKMDAAYRDTRLKRLRLFYELTQSELSKKSGVNLRSIQMYEQRNKDINKASAETLYKLAKVLGCSMEALLEKHSGKSVL